ncbi:MAG: LysE family translocator [Bacteroidota bacterium]|nr:LysE family translocator [Bacteroidota bacterium]
MFDTQNLYLFFLASILLNLTPGSDMIYVASRSISQGMQAGVFSAIGVFIGCLVHILAAILGLSFIISESAFLFEIIKFTGAGYLIYLGIKALLSKSNFSREIEKVPVIDKWKLLKQGIITNALNPKVAIFFLSFLPQFIDPASPLFKMQLLILGFWFDIQGTIVLIIVAYVFGKTKNFLKQNQKILIIQERLTGLILIGLGIKLALTSKK